MHKLSQAALLSSAIGVGSASAQSGEQGFTFGLGYENYGSSTYDLTVPTASLVRNDFFIEEGILPRNLHFSMSRQEGIHANFGWRSAEFKTGAVILTYGATLTGSYYNKTHINADFTDELAASRGRLITRITDIANDRFSEHFGGLGIDPQQSRRFFNRAATYLVNNPNAIQPLSEAQLRELLPPDLNDEVRDRIIEDVIPRVSEISREVYGSDVLRGLRDLDSYDANYSDSAQSASVTIEAFARATLDIAPVSPYVQGNIGYQAFGFIADDDRSGGLFHGPTASVMVGLTGDFNENISWDAYLEKPFALEQSGPYGLTTQNPDDVIVGVGIQRQGRIVNYGLVGTYTPETDAAGVQVNFGF